MHVCEGGAISCFVPRRYHVMCHVRLSTELHVSYMTENRLSSLALMHIHYKRAVDLDDVVTLFAELAIGAVHNFFPQVTSL